MARHIEDEVAYYYDSHPIEEDLMGETSDHFTLVDYLKDVLKWLFHAQLCAIYKNVNFYQTTNKDEKPVAPDIAVIESPVSSATVTLAAEAYGVEPARIAKTLSLRIGERVVLVVAAGTTTSNAFSETSQ